MRTVNMPGGEIMPAAQRGTIDCAEWVGGIEDLRFGFHTIWKYHYAPSLHESVSIGEIADQQDRRLEKISCRRSDQEIMKAAATEHHVPSGGPKLAAPECLEALIEMREKHKRQHGDQTPTEIHHEFLKAWDPRRRQVVRSRAPPSSGFWESQKAWASISVPARSGSTIRPTVAGRRALLGRARNNCR